MNSFLGRMRFSWSALQMLQQNRILSQNLRTRTLHFNSNLCVPEKAKNSNIVFKINPVSEEINYKNKTSLYYLSALTILVGGFTYMSVLLYRIYCQSTGKGGQAVIEEVGDKIANMNPVKHRKITVRFNADIHSSMMWNFKPEQTSVKVAPGETALAFYSAVNPTDRAVTGIATYNVLPFEAGKYFNKIQCFCFEEQQLNPHEEVDMPVFFYLDPQYAEDPFLENVNEIYLSYTFFEAKEGMQLPLPGFLQGK